jgi:ABC-2 type transport system permease protein
MKTATNDQLAARAPGPWRAAQKYLKIFRVSLIERMAYRGDFLLGTVLRFLPLVTTILIWQAAYAGAAPAAEGEKKFSGFTEHEMMAYLLLVHISRMFSSMPGLAYGITADIREGTLKKYLIQPLDMIGYLLSYRAAHKVAYVVTSALPYAVLFVVCSGFFAGVDLPDAPRAAGYAAALLLSFLIGFFFETAIGMIGFWFLEVTSFLYVVNTLNFFISGQMFPLDLLPSFWRSVFDFLPFKYLAYFPAAVFLGKVRDADLACGLLVEGAWAILLMLLARWLYARGLRRYSAFGG